MCLKRYPIIDIYKTGQRIKQIMKCRGFSVCDVKEYLGLETPQSIYHWFNGRNLPTTDNLYALSELFHVPIDTILCGDRKVKFDFSNYLVCNTINVYYVTIQSQPQKH